MSEPNDTEGTVLGQGFIIALLVGGLMLLWWFAPEDGAASGAAVAMVALGFVVLASATVGHLAETVGLPHITGYLVAGVLLGGSFAELLPPGARIPPFDRGVLDERVVRDLGLLDALAVALIALTAGGELKLDTLRKGLRVISGVLAGQIVTVALLVGAFFVLVSGVVAPGLVLPGLEGVGSLDAAIAVGLVVAAISLATSPAATIAVINGAEARGPMTSVVLSSVVLKDVLVVVAFSLATALASRVLGVATTGESLGTFFLVHIGGSLAAGVALGLGTALYLRWVDREVLLFLVGVVYVATYAAATLHLDPVLLFIAAGFTASNFSAQGERLVHNLEKLSTPVYVVFFTLAGARLHLEEVAALAPFALGLVAVRVLGYAVGVSVGARLGGADLATRRYGWLGFISQAGVAISLSAIVGRTFGETGRALETLLIAGVALNELLGPVLLKVALGLAGEIPARRERASEAPARPSEPPRAAEPARVGWGARLPFRSPALVEAMAAVVDRLDDAARALAHGEVADRAEDADHLLGELRRDVLRAHRRLLVAARAEPLDARALAREEHALLVRLRRNVVATLDEMRRDKGFSVLRLAEAVDAAVAAAPERLAALHEPEAPAPLAARALRRLARRGEPERAVPLRELLRYHLGGLAIARLPELDARLEATAAGVAEPLLRALDASLEAYRARVGAAAGAPPGVALSELAAARRDAERAVAAAREQTAARFAALPGAAVAVLADAVAATERDLVLIGTRWLPARQRRASAVFRPRARALRALEERAAEPGRRAGAALARAAVDLDLRALGHRLEAVRADVLDRLVAEVRGRTAVQLERLEGALAEVRPTLEATWVLTPEDAAPLRAAELRDLSEPVLRTMREAESEAAGLRDRLAGDDELPALVDALERAALEVGERYELAADDAPNAPIVEVPLRAIVAADIEDALARDLRRALDEVVEPLGPLAIALRETWRLAVLNVDLAAAELEVAEAGEPLAEGLLQQLVEPGLERAEAVTGTYLEQTRRLAPALDLAFAEALRAAMARLRRELLEEPLSESRLRALRQAVAAGRRRRDVADRRTFVGDAFAAATRVLFGEEEGPRGAGGAAPLEARWRAAVPSDLPLAYRRLFAGEALEANEAALPGHLDGAALAERLAGRAGRLRTLALVGPPGVGKLAVLRGLARSRAFSTVRRLVLEGPTDEAALHEALDGVAQGQGGLVALIGLEWLLRPGRGGAAAVDALVARLLADAGRNAWVAPVDTLPFAMARALTPLGDAFPDVVDVRPLDAARLRDALLARHALSRYELVFDRGRDDPDGPVTTRGAGLASAAADRFFEGLHRAAGGRVRDALRLWLASVTRVDEGELAVHVGLPPEGAGPALAALDAEALLELHAVERWGWMDAAGFADSFRLGGLEAEARLARLAQVGLLEPANGVAYRTAAHLRGPAHQVFEGRGWTT